MPIQKNFLRKLWWDCRTGNAAYLMLSLQFVNFILITYSYLIEGNAIFENLVFNLGLFSIVFVISYVPVSILVGRWHQYTQLHVESTIKMEENPITAKMIRTLLDAKTGKATKEEIEEFRKFVKEIESRDINEF